MLNKKPTPIISKLHIRINMSLNDVFTFDLPPRIWFFWKILENHRAMLTANKAFIVETASIIRAANNDPDWFQYIQETNTIVMERNS